MILAFALGRDTGTKHDAKPSGPPPPVTVSPPPSNPAAVGPCVQVLTALPVKLGPLTPRAVFADRTVAWGDPAIVLRCGVDRPAQFVPTSQLFNVGDVYWLAVKHKSATVWTVIDRSVYIEVTVPAKQGYMPLPIIGTQIASKLEPVCAVPQDNVTYRPEQLCVNRK